MPVKVQVTKRMKQGINMEFSVAIAVYSCDSSESRVDGPKNISRSCRVYEKDIRCPQIIQWPEYLWFIV